MNWLDVPICKKHQWRWVETWHGVGFKECSTCGMTSSVMLHADLNKLPPEDTGVPDQGMPPLPGRMGRPIDPATSARKAAILEALDAGGVPQEIAERFSVKTQRVYQIRSQAKLARQRAAEAQAATPAVAPEPEPQPEAETV